MAKLDKSKPFGTVSGYGENHVYEQDGLKFDGMGDEIGKPKAKKPEPKTIKPVENDTKIETRLLIVDKNANGYLSIKEIKAALVEAGVEFKPRNNSRKSLIALLKDYMGVN